jgi:preprotein translocase subunit SecA
MLDMQGVPHNVLNAKHHEREAQIVAQAGRSGAVTIATNMAGRGTDILLGGNPEGYYDAILHKHAEQVDYIREMPTDTPDERKEKEEAILEYLEQMEEDEKQELLQQKIQECKEDHEKVVELGGLYILGTERHESRRIDNQLRGRAGRQGDPGTSRFFLALDDELMRRFAADRVAGMMERFGMEEDMPLENKIVTRMIEGAQRQIEGYNFDIRKNVVEYDDVIAEQRRVIYKDRRAVLEKGDMHDRILSMIKAEVAHIVSTNVPTPMVTEEEQLEALYRTLETWVPIPADMVPENIHAIKRDDLKRDMTDLVLKHYEKRGQELKKQAREQGIEGVDPQREFERSYLLQIVDRLWMDHIDSLDVMRAGIGFRAIGQRDPLVEFKNEAYRMFDELKTAIQHYTVDSLLKLLRNEVSIQVNRPEPPRRTPRNLRTNVADIERAIGQTPDDDPTAKRNGNTPRHQQRGPARPPASPARPPHSPSRIGRNDPCPCGSGKKYKKCHGA